MMSIRTSLAAALMCGAMALPAAAAGVGASANGTAGIDTTAQNAQTNSAASTQASGSIGAPSSTAGVNGGINAQSAPEQTAMNANGNMASDTANAPAPSNAQQAANQPEEAGAQTGLKDNGSASQNMAMQNGAASASGQMAANESAFRDVGGDTSTKYRAKNRSADFEKEAQVTAQLNQEAAKMAAPSGT